MDPIDVRVQENILQDDRPVALVTGAGSGVGATAAIRLAETGHQICVGYCRNESGAAQTVAACRAAGADALAVCVDVTNDAACRAFVAAAIDRWGRIDGLVNNAGATMFVAQNDLDALTADHFEQLNRVNVVGPYQIMRAASPHLAEREGAIVNVSSLSGLTGRGSSTAYATSKAALNMLTVVMARVLAPVRVNAVLPGMIDTDWMLRGIGADGWTKARSGYERNAALGRICTPADIADTILWLLRNPSITGELIRVDAGLSVGR